MSDSLALGLPHDLALAHWEDEGGSVAAGERALPVLPAGYEAHPAWGFREAGRCYEFCRVYGPTDHANRRGPLSQLDKPRSYWRVTYPCLEVNGSPGRWVSYAEARKRYGRRLTFNRFASAQHMRAHLVELLHVRTD